MLLWLRVVKYWMRPLWDEDSIKHMMKRIIRAAEGDLYNQTEGLRKNLCVMCWAVTLWELYFTGHKWHPSQCYSKERHAPQEVLQPPAHSLHGCRHSMVLRANAKTHETIIYFSRAFEDELEHSVDRSDSVNTLNRPIQHLSTSSDLFNSKTRLWVAHSDLEKKIINSGFP